jgi:hypothetical protein
MTDTTPIPPKVATAICAVMGDVPKLGKGEKNSHGNYNFASIDDFLEAVRPLCAKHGLIIAQDEESVENVNGWLMIRFAFTLAHVSGETWPAKQMRTAMVNAKMGSQAFGAAQSYALKQYMRALFQIATGEKGNDADEHAPADLPDLPRGKTSRDADWVGPLNKTKLSSEFHKLQREVEAVKDEATLDGIVKREKPLIAQALKDHPTLVEGDGGDILGLRGTVERRRQIIRDVENAREADNISFPA